MCLLQTYLVLGCARSPFTCDIVTVGGTDNSLQLASRRGNSRRPSTSDATASAQCDEFRDLKSWKSPNRANAWQHLYVAYDGMSWVLYVDGVQTDETEFSVIDTYFGELQLNRFMPESHAPLVLGREMDREVIEGSPSDIRRYYGLVYLFAMWGQPKMGLVSSRPDANVGHDMGDLMVSLHYIISTY